MGTTFEVKLVARKIPQCQIEIIRQEILTQLDDVNGKMSTYLSSSEISRLNRSRETSPQRLSRKTITVLAEARHISTITQGAFDITVGPLVNIWGFGPESRSQKTPTPEEILELKSQTGWEKIELNKFTSTVRKSDPSLYCDLSAIAKGYAVDQVSAALVQKNFLQHMVELGGEIKTRGRNLSGKPWKIAIERPSIQGRTLQRIIPLESLAIATSGDYRNFYQENGVRLSHTIDPRTGHPVKHCLASVSVIDVSCMRADGYATALMVLGETDGYRLAMEHNLAALFLVRTLKGSFLERESPAFQRLF